MIQKERRKREKNFLVQVNLKFNLKKITLKSFIICGFLEFEDIAFNFIPVIFASLKGQWPFLVTFAENWVNF
jgi:hypothetical protein